MTLQLRYAAVSDRGLLRDGNEDSVYAGPRLLAVADGMGGHAAGEVASAVAIAAVAPLDEDVPGADLLDALRDAAETANDRLREMVSADGALDGMGTTLTAMLWAGSRVGVLHVGDSRAYLLRGGQLAQITHDHTLVQTLVDEQRISADEASSHPQRSLLTRALDGREGVDPDLSVREARPGDRYLLCTDGLSGVVSQQTMLETLQTEDRDQAARRLVELALRGGGPDNISVIVADVVEAGGRGGTEVLVGGAAATSPQTSALPTGDTAAHRAAVAEGRGESRPRTDAEPPAAAARRRRTGRALLLAGIAALLLAAAAVTGVAYARSQYYVGVDGDEVAVFRGVRGSIGSLDLHSVTQRPGIAVDDLTPFEQRRVRQGIDADSPADADSIVDRLRTTARSQTAPATGADPTPTPSPAPDPTADPAPPSPGPGA